MAKFDKETRAYLLGLDAVQAVSETRIEYTSAFRRDCMERYRAGESPSAIFRAAGLGPEIIGRKRIECCMARWRDQDEGSRRSPAYPTFGNGAKDDARANLIMRQLGRIRQLEDEVRRLNDEIVRMRAASRQ